MVNQLLLGETARVTSVPDHLWIQVESTVDRYPGFVGSNMVAQRPSGWPLEFETRKNDAVRLRSTFALLLIEGERWMLPMGSRLLREEGGRFRLPDGRSGKCLTADAVWLDETPLKDDRPLGVRMMRVAEDLIGTPYLWGGKSSFGIDCSGLVQVCGFLCGVVLPRDAYMQFSSGDEVALDRERLEEGDLLFFDYPWGDEKINHVAFYAGNGRILHASGRVRWNSFNKKDSDYSEKHLESLTGARRLSRVPLTTEVVSSSE